MNTELIYEGLAILICFIRFLFCRASYATIGIEFGVGVLRQAMSLRMRTRQPFSPFPLDFLHNRASRSLLDFYLLAAEAFTEVVD